MADEPTTEEFLHSFGMETAQALKKAAVQARDVIVLAKVYNEAHRLQRIVTSLTQDQTILDAAITASTLQYESLKTLIDGAQVQLADETKLVEEARASAETVIAAEVEAFKQAEYQRGKTDVEALLSESNREYTVVQGRLATALIEIETATVKHGEVLRAVAILENTKKQLIDDITTIK